MILSDYSGVAFRTVTSRSSLSLDVRENTRACSAGARALPTRGRTL